MMNWRTRSSPDLGPRLVAKLGLDLVPDLRQLLVAAQLAAGDGGHHLFVRHAQAQGRAGSGPSAGTCCRPSRPSGPIPATTRPGAAPAAASPARRWRPSPRGRSAGSSAASAAPETGSCKFPPQAAGCSRRAAAAGGWRLPLRPGLSRRVGMNSLLQSIGLGKEFQF